MCKRGKRDDCWMTGWWQMPIPCQPHTHRDDAREKGGKKQRNRKVTKGSASWIQGCHISIFFSPHQMGICLPKRESGNVVLGRQGQQEPLRREPLVHQLLCSLVIDPSLRFQKHQKTQLHRSVVRNCAFSRGIPPKAHPTAIWGS